MWGLAGLSSICPYPSTFVHHWSILLSLLLLLLARWEVTGCTLLIRFLISFVLTYPGAQSDGYPGVQSDGVRINVVFTLCNSKSPDIGRRVC